MVRSVGRVKTVVPSEPPFTLDCTVVRTNSPINGGDKDD